jgi:hypothetical protein
MKDSQTEHELLGCLRDLGVAVKRLSEGGTPPDFLEIFSRIDAVAARLPAGTDPQLLHYLKKKSYEKAQAYLEGSSEIPAGSCDRK